MDNKPIEWEELPAGGLIWKPQAIGEKLAGVIVAIQEGDYGDQYVLLTKDNKEIILPAHTALLSILEGKVIKGDLIDVEYCGEKPSKKGSPLQLYKVKKAKTPIIEEEPNYLNG